jgi:predicted GH43/DUF377 family glycosyl hydrolase
MSERSLVFDALEKRGQIAPIILPPEVTKGTGLFNPSVLIDDGKILVNLRHCQYTIYHSEKNKFEHEYGPLVYLNPENDITLTTTNYICELDNNLNTIDYKKIDTSHLDVKPIWEFVGLEDVRLVRWNGVLYGSGVRRDTTPNGVGRMELSTLEYADNQVKETSRFRIPAPGTDNSYCEKNWMPILDKPYHYVKWCNPTEVVKVDPESKTCETVFLGKTHNIPYDLRGGSQVIKIGDRYITLVHAVNLFQSEAGRKNAVYRHAFVIWDKDFNFIKTTKLFNFMGAHIEFCAGMAQQGDDLLITFGFQDNAAYILRTPLTLIEEYLND